MKARVIHIITKLELGGAQQNTLYTVENLDRERFSLALWTGEGGILNDDAKNIPDIDFEIVPELVREISPSKEFAALWQLRSMLKDEIKNSDVPVIVHTHSSKAGILGRWAAYLAGVPIIIQSFHGFGFNPFQSFFVRAMYKTAEWMTGKVTDHFIAVSRANLEEAVSLGIASEKNMSLIRSGIDISEFKRQDIDTAKKKEELGVPPGGQAVLMVACHKPQKNPLNFVKVAKKVLKEVPNAYFLSAGDGELRPDMEAAVKEAGIEDNFLLLGWRRDVPELMWCSDILVLTSLWEGLPRVYPQAMAAGLPIVGTKVDGGPEAVIDGKNGWLLGVDDIDGISKKVTGLLKDRKMARKMGAAGMRLVEEFDIGLMVRQQEELYENLLDHRLDKK